MGLTGIFGTLGMGKTLTMTRYGFLRKVSELMNGNNSFRVISNYDLSYSDMILDSDAVDNILQNEQNLSNSILLIDEMPAFLDSRESSSKKNKMLTNFIRHTRKLSVELVYTSQFFDLVDIRLRKFTDIFMFPEPISSTNFCVTILEKNVLGSLNVKGRYVFSGEKFWNLYDTNQIIKRKEVVKG